MKSYVALLICLFSIPAIAQGPAPQKPPQTPIAPRTPSVPQPAKPPAVPEVPASPAVPMPPAPPSPPRGIDDTGGQAVNIRLDVSVIDQREGRTAEPKTLMVILADRAMGQTRAAYEERSISVDARPTVTDGLIRVSVTVKSSEPPRMMPMPGPEGFKGSDPTVNWTNSFNLLLQSGKPMIALETSDAVTKRKMSIEVKATILK